MAAQPGSSVPQQMGSWGQTLAAYRLLNNPHVSAEALWQPHLAATLTAARAEAVVLFVHDWTTLDYTQHPTTTGIGPVGSRSQRGLLLHTVLAVEPTGRQVLGLAHLQPIIRAEHRQKPAGNQRHRGPEGEAWEAGVKAVGTAPEGATWVHVSDRESDVYGYMAACVAHDCGFVIRACRNRKVGVGPRGREAGKLMEQARALLPRSGPRHTYTVTVPATKQAPARQATIVLSWCKLLVPPPSYAAGQPTLSVWVVRAWEEKPPSGATRVEWILLTSEPVETATVATQIVEWYSCRWLIEDYHMCLKTGCQVERSQLDDGADLQRLLGFVAPLAVRLLQLRQAVRTAPETPAQQQVDPLLVQLLAAKQHLPLTMSVVQFWGGVARLGGHLGRKSDGPPGWRTLWRGWRTLCDYALGARLIAPAAPPPPP
jgi:hypothetical protein